MKKSLFPKFAVLLLALPLLFAGCTKIHFKSFVIGESSGEHVQYRNTAVSCTHPGTAADTRCEVDINEDGNNDLTFIHFQNANSDNVTRVQGPSGFSLVIDSVVTNQGVCWPGELEKDTELNENNWWFALTKDVRRMNFDLGDDNEGYFGFRWGTYTQRSYGWIKLRKTNDTDFVIDEWAFQVPEPINE